MADFNTIDDLDLDGKVVLTRVDLNVPVENGKVSPKRLGKFIDEYGPVLAHAPESKIQFDGMIASARAGHARPGAAGDLQELWC